MLRWIVFAVLIVTGCEKPPIQWNDPISIAQPAVPSRLAVDLAGRAQFVALGSGDPEPFGRDRSPDTGLCAASLRMVPGTAHWFAAWWHVRLDSSAALQMARSDDGGKTWERPMPVDTADISSNGCDRPAPSVATVGDDLYVAYSMAAPEGKGVFFAHTMGSMLHAPVSVIYGERLVPTAIAAEGDRAIVAYEEPNGMREQIDIALSSTQGHIFEWHTTASRSVDAARSPAVALAGREVAVSWLMVRTGDTTRNRVVRVGRIAN